MAWLRFLPAALIVLPALAERLGVRVEEESLRLPCVFLALGLSFFPVAPGKPRRTAWLLVVLALIGGLALLQPRGASLLGLAGVPYLPVLAAAAILAGARWLGDLPHRRAFAQGLLLSSVVAALWILLDRIDHRAGVGPFGRTGVGGPALAACLPFLALPLLARGSGTRDAKTLLTRGLPLLLCVVALALTGSRTGMVAGAVGLAIGAGALLRSARVQTVASIATGLVVVTYVLALTGVVPLSEAGGTTMKVRAGVAQAAATLVIERPMGHGAYGFPAEVLRVRDLTEARISEGRRPLAAHDDVLHVAVEGGVVAAIGLALLLLAAPVLAVRAARRASHSAERSWLAAAAGSIAVIGISSLAENPMLSSITVAIFGLAAGACTSRAAGRADSTGRRARAERIAGGVLLAGLAVLHVAVLLESPESRLEDGSFRESESSRAAAYRVGVRLARAGEPEKARTDFEILLATDPGATEARLDIAEIHRLERKTDVALQVLDEAGRFDPTRFEVPQRRGHLLLGDEAAPSRRVPLENPLPVLRAYNDAAALAPDRFETRVAYARVHRRRGELARAGAELRTAKQVAVDHGRGLPAELLLESFRLAEAEGAPTSSQLGILALALEADPALARALYREATACLDAGSAIEEASPKPPETGPAPWKKDYDAGSLRLAALVTADLLDRGALRREADSLAEAGRRRRALALYMALIADPFATGNADLLLKAREVASTVDRPLADVLVSRARTVLGFEALEKGDAKKAEFEFRAALSRDGQSVAAQYGLARAYARQGRPADATRALDAALELDPSLVTRVALDPDLRGVPTKDAHRPP